MERSLSLMFNGQRLLAAVRDLRPKFLSPYLGVYALPATIHGLCPSGPKSPQDKVRSTVDYESSQHPAGCSYGSASFSQRRLPRRFSYDVSPYPKHPCCRFSQQPNPCMPSGKPTLHRSGDPRQTRCTLGAWPVLYS